MKTVFIDAKWEKKIVLSKEVLEYLMKNKVKSVALFASVQFLNLDYLKSQLSEKGIKVLTAKAKRTHAEGQMLGCDAYHDSFEKDIISQAEVLLYIGDGLFHPKALLLSQIYSKTIKPVLQWDPVSEKMRLLDEKDVLDQIKRMKRNLKLFISAKTIGILVTVKPGQQYLDSALKLKEMLQKKGKSCYIFLDNTLDFRHFENYPFIEAWVNTACPRIGTDDITTLEQPLLNIREAYDPIKALEKLSL